MHRIRLPASLVSAIATLILLAPASFVSADWPQWRGPNRDGVAAPVDLEGWPDAGGPWPEKLERRWSVKVGEGHAGPVTSGDTIFLFSREGGDEMLRALRLADGSERWRRSWKAPYEMHPAARGHGKGPKATPVLAGGRLCGLGISGILVCVDAGDGRLLWRKDFGDQHQTTSPLYGSAASPLIEDDLLVAHVGGHHDGALTAFDVATGKERWSLKGDGPGYASPVVASLGGIQEAGGHLARRQVVTQTDRRIVGVDVAKGKLLWERPFTTPYDQNSVTPIPMPGAVILSGLEQGLLNLAPYHRKGELLVKERWKVEGGGFYMSTPVIAGGRLVGLSPERKGHFVARDVETGKVIWESPGRDGENAALILAKDVLLALTTEAELLVLAADATSFAPLARYTVAETPTWAHPAPVAGGILIKDKETLALWIFPRPAAPRAPAPKE